MPVRQALSRRNLWGKTPPRLKRSIGTFLRFVPSGFLLGRQFRSSLDFVRSAQWWPIERARNYQLEQLRKICTLAYEETAYYRETFRNVGFEPRDLRSLDDLARLPTIDKQTLRDRLRAMCSVSPEAANVDYVTTGGTSGEPLRFYFGPGRSAIEYSYLIASWERAEYRLGLPMAVFRGQVVAPGRDGLRHEYDAILRRHYFSNFHMSEENIRGYFERISTLGPRVFLLVYPSSGAALARYAKRSGGSLPGNVAGILAGSENVYPDERSEVERVFGVRYFSWYGHSEKLVLAAECEGSSDYHVWPTYGFMELIDAEGRRVTAPGRRGEIVGTGFMNTIVPFIRYRTGDFAEYVGERCDACGRQHTIVRNVEGRWPQGCLVAHDGSLVSMTAFNVHDDTFESVKGYQFRQMKPGEATLRVVPARPLSEAERAHIVGGASARLQGQVSLTLEMCDELERTPAGKQLRVIQSLPLGFEVSRTSAGVA